MDKPRIFLGSSGKQKKLLQALTRHLEDVAHVDPWTTSFHPGTTTLARLVEACALKSTSPRSCSLGTTGRPPAPAHPPPRDPVRLLRETMSSKPAFSVELSECAEPSYSMRATRNFRAISGY
jgi:hypothetical protein